MRRWKSFVVLLAVLALGAAAGCDLLFVDHPPMAVFEVVYNPVEGQPLVVTLDASMSYDEDGDPMTAYLWAVSKLGGDIGEGVEYYPQGWITDTVTDPTITIRFPVEGTYTVELQVRSVHLGEETGSDIVMEDVIVPDVPMSPTL